MLTNTVQLESFLALPELEVTAFAPAGGNGVNFYCRKNTEFEVCPHCAQKTWSVKEHVQVIIKDAPIRGTPVTLYISKRRFRCYTCSKVFREYIPGILKGKRTTERFKRHVAWAAEHFSNLDEARRSVGCSTAYLYQAHYEILGKKPVTGRANGRALSVLTSTRSNTGKKGRIGYVTMVVSHTTRRVIELVDGQSSEVLAAALSGIKGRGNVKTVTLDLDEAFRKYARATFPNASLIADHFHVIQLFTKALNRVRIAITGDQRKNPIRNLLLRNAEELEGFEHRALWQWLHQHPSAKELYTYKEAIRRIYKARGYAQARRRLKRLLDTMGRSELKSAQTLRQTLLNWFREIVNFFRHNRKTNARVEGFTTRAKLLQRRAFGYKNFENYRLRLLNDCA